MYPALVALFPALACRLSCCEDRCMANVGWLALCRVSRWLARCLPFALPLISLSAPPPSMAALAPEKYILDNNLEKINGSGRRAVCPPSITAEKIKAKFGEGQYTSGDEVEGYGNREWVFRGPRDTWFHVYTRWDEVHVGCTPHVLEKEVRDFVAWLRFRVKVYNKPSIQA